MILGWMRLMLLAPPIFIATPVLAAIGFAAPWWLLGATAVVLPILAHWRWRHRGRGVAIPFPAVRFLQAAVLEEQIRRQPSHFLLLLLRCLMILLAALAFARPIYRAGAPFAFRPPVETTSERDPGTKVVVVIDASASMQRVDRGVTLFDRARIEANRVLDRVEEIGDATVGVVIAGGSASARALLPQAGFQFEELRERLAAEQAAFSRADMRDALRVAAALTGGGQGGDDENGTVNRQVVVITDGQASEWEGDIAGFGTGVVFSMIRAGSDAALGEFNVSLENATAAPLRPIAGESVTLSVEVVRAAKRGLTATSRVAQLRVQLEVGREHFERVVKDLQPGERRLISIQTALLEAPVWLPIHWSIKNDDEFELDNRLSTGLVVRAKRAVGILTASEGLQGSADIANNRDRGRLTNSDFLSAALMPTADSPVRVTMLSPSDLAGTGADDAWRKLDVMVIHEAGEMTLGVLSALDQFVLAGGGILWVLDSPAALRGWGEFEELHHLERTVSATARGDALLPFAALEWVEVESGEATGGLALARSANWFTGLPNDNHPLGQLDEQAVQALLTTGVTAYVYGQTTPVGTTIFEFENRAPAFVTGRLGRGRLGVLTFALAPPTSSLMRQPMFVPFIHEVVRWLVPNSELVEQVVVGDSIRLVLAREIENPEQLQVDPAWAERSFELVLQPGSYQSRAGDGDKVGPSPDWIVRIPVALEPGLVELRTVDTGALRGLAGVHLDPRESQLRSLTMAEEESLLSELNGGRNRDAEQTEGDAPMFESWMDRIAAAEGNQVRELWTWCVLLVLICALLEHVLQLRLPRSTHGHGPGGVGGAI